jgi:hypothetical protein
MVEDVKKLRFIALRALRLHNKWENQSDYRPGHWRVLSPPDPSSIVDLEATPHSTFVWFADEDTVVHVIGGMTHWRDGRTGALLTSFHTKYNLLFGDTCFINGELFMAAELENNPQDPSRYVQSLDSSAV